MTNRGGESAAGAVVAASVVLLVPLLILAALRGGANECHDARRSGTLGEFNDGWSGEGGRIPCCALLPAALGRVDLPGPGAKMG